MGVGGGEQPSKLWKPLIYKAQMKREGIPRRGYPWGYAKPIKDRSLPSGIVLEKLPDRCENRRHGVRPVSEARRIRRSWRDSPSVAGRRTLDFAQDTLDDAPARTDGLG
jgi:hypothetical protein